MVPTIFVALTVYFTLNLILAMFYENVAALKGYGKDVHAFGMVFFLGIIGCIYVAALPDKIRQEQGQQIISMLFEKNRDSLD